MRAFSSRANNVTIRSVIVEKYASAPSMAPIFPDTWQNPGGTGWVTEDNEVRWNHASGISVGSGARILRNFVHHNGEIGIAGTGTSVLVEGNEIAFNNYNVWFNWQWEGGATKFVRNSGLTVRNNRVHDNHGAGLWTDHDNFNVVIEGNTIENNEGPGVFHEVSCDAVIRNNVIRNNRVWGNVYISNSRNTEVYGNTVEGHGIFGNVDNRPETGANCSGAFVVENLWVHDNTLTLTSTRMGLRQQVGDQGYFTSRNNRFETNHYDVADPAGAYWMWMDGTRTWAQWRGYGQDLNGSVK
jgi:parallel beta-helix repeat protein